MKRGTMLFSVLPTSELSESDAGHSPHRGEPGEPLPVSPSCRASQLFRWVSLGLSVLLCATALCCFGFALVSSFRYRTKMIPGVVISGEPLGSVSFGALPARLHDLAEQVLNRRVRLRIGQEQAVVRLRELGFRIDESAVLQACKTLGHSGDPLSDWEVRLRGQRSPHKLDFLFSLDAQKSHQFLVELKDQVDRAAVDARLDLEKHTVAPERPGYLLRVYDSMVGLEYLARSLSAGQAVSEWRLSVAETQPLVRKQDLTEIDVSTVLASWETRYSTAAIDSDRTFNLKVGADKLNGYVLRPGQLFSFNAAVGDRTEKEGYRVAPVISGGELIDGLAGGMCQIASTLHAAAFFAGLDLVRATPHSRPSTYIPMGLDSTVVYPSVDLKLKNPFDFPVVIHFVVHQGTVRVELLGKPRPFQVAFEREILEETPFATVTRPDPDMPTGQQFTDQDGYPGYRIKRRRYQHLGAWKTDPKDEGRGNPDELLSKREWDLSYPSTTQIVRVGTGSPKLPKKTPPPSHRIPPLPAWAKPLWVIRK